MSGSYYHGIHTALIYRVNETTISSSSFTAAAAVTSNCAADPMTLMSFEVEKEEDEEKNNAEMCNQGKWNQCGFN